MNKIEEMAKKAADKMWGTPDPHDYTDLSGCGAAHSNYAAGYEDGVRFMLEEIEKVLNNASRLTNGRYNSGWLISLPEILKEKIEQLKKG